MLLSMVIIACLLFSIRKTIDNFIAWALKKISSPSVMLVVLFLNIMTVRLSKIRKFGCSVFVDNPGWTFVVQVSSLRGCMCCVYPVLHDN